MDKYFDRCKFLRVSRMSPGIGALISVAPATLAHPCPLHRHHRLDRGRCLFAQEPQPRVVTISAKRFQLTLNQITLERGEPVTLRVSARSLLQIGPRNIKMINSVE
jgi:hypothetical protein